jgi:hypothetical protein
VQGYLPLTGRCVPHLYDWIAEYQRCPCVRTTFLTAYTLTVLSHRFLARTRRPVPEKPFVLTELRQLLAQVLPDTRG